MKGENLVSHKKSLLNFELHKLCLINTNGIQKCSPKELENVIQIELNRVKYIKHTVWTLPPTISL